MKLGQIGSYRAKKGFSALFELDMEWLFSTFLGLFLWEMISKMMRDDGKSGDNAGLIYCPSLKVTHSAQSPSAIHGTHHIQDFACYSVITMNKA